MHNSIHFYEVDAGSEGIIWEAHSPDGYLSTYHGTDDMIVAARSIYGAGGSYRIYTQEEYNLRWEIEDGQARVSA